MNFEECQGMSMRTMKGGGGGVLFGARAWTRRPRELKGSWRDGADDDPEEVLAQGGGQGSQGLVAQGHRR